jgi:hypothetical protein
LLTGLLDIFLKFDHPIYENDTSPFEKGGSRGIIDSQCKVFTSARYPGWVYGDVGFGFGAKRAKYIVFFVGNYLTVCFIKFH